MTLQKGRTKFMLIEYCLVGCKKTFPCYVVFAAGTARGRAAQTEIVKKKKPAEIAGEREGKQRDHASMSHVPIRIGEKFWACSQEARTLER